MRKGINDGAAYGAESRLPGTEMTGFGDSGSASRYFKSCPADEGDYDCMFYCAKASKAERNRGCEGNFHPTVKPLSLMAYLVRLVTPPGGTVLDPFCGSGTTIMAARQEGFKATGIEKEVHYCEIARCRVRAVGAGQMTIFNL